MNVERLLRFSKKYIPHRFFLFFQPAYHFTLSCFSALWYRFPSRRLTVIGVTGTKGKTTVVELLYEILQEAGTKGASSSSLRFRIAGKEIRNEWKMTMPGRFFVQRLLRDAYRAGCTYAVLEVTSEGIKQFRHRFIRFDIAVVTNVSPEHIEAHGSFEKYLRTKLDLFWRLPAGSVAVINRDDPHAPRFSAATAAHRVWYGKEGIEISGKTWRIRDAEITPNGIACEVGGQEFSSPLVGEFNFSNILAATAVALSQHISLERIAAAIARVAGIPGRMEFVQKEPVAVIVDYAHTPDSLREVYRFLRSYKLQDRNCKLICVLGAAGGGRDKWKRPELGKIAAEFCDEVILTNEDSYDEDPAEILEQIAQGFQQLPASRFPLPATRKILDRREAIRDALKSATPGDIVIVTGKGAEPWMMGPAGTKIPWDDREVVREELTKLVR